MGSNNFQVFDAPKNNMQTDAQYANDPMRLNGASTGAIIASPLFNKFAGQVSTFTAAFGQMMAAKGYNISDADAASLAGTLSNVVTQADLKPNLKQVPYSPNPVFDASNANGFRFSLAGTVTSSSLINLTPYQILTFAFQGTFPFSWPGNVHGGLQPPSGLTSDVSIQQFVVLEDLNAYAIDDILVSLINQKQTALGFTPVQQGGGSGQTGDKVYIGSNGSGLKAQVNSSDLGSFVFNGQFSSSISTLQGEIDTLSATKQNNLGFTPVQQGGGSGQGTNKVYIGWTGSNLKAQVDTSDLGNIIFQSALDSLISSSASANGWLEVAGILIQWGTTGTMNPTEQFINFNTSFPNACWGVNVSCMSASFNQGRTVYTKGWNTSGFTAGANGNDCQIFWIAIGN